MSDTAPNLALPYIMAAQAQKHVTHNEAIRALDAVVQLGVLDRHLATPPASPSDGARYIVAAMPMGDWAGAAGKIAAFQDGAWAIYPPREGWVAWVADEDVLVAWNGTAWVSTGGGGITLNPATGGMVGVNTTADTTNRLAVKSDAVLFSHDDVTPGSGNVRIAVNKKNATDTASLLFQNGFSGRAEVGLAGDDRLRIKVSADGAAWQEAISVDPTTGRVGIGASQFLAQMTLSADSTLAGLPHVRFVGRTNPNNQLLFGYDTVVNVGFIQPVTQTVAYRDFALVPNGGNLGVGTSSPVAKLAVEGHIAPQTDNAHSCGTSARRWSALYSTTGTINTSDERLKADVVDCPLGLSFITALKPRLYRWKSGATELIFDDEAAATGDDTKRVRLGTVERTGRRQHAGLIAQEVKAALDAAGVDCGMWVLGDTSDRESTQSLRYDQLIAPLIQAVKELAAKVQLLERLERTAT